MIQSAPAKTPARSQSTDCACDDAFGSRLTPHLPALHAVARRILRSHDLACDAVQEALLSLWMESAEPPDLHGWLVRTTVHKCLHVLRSQVRRGRHEESAGAQRQESCPLCDPAATTEDAELRGRLDHAIAALSEELRVTFLLRSEQGLDYREIADALSIPIGTVRSRLARARESLHEQLAGSRR